MKWLFLFWSLPAENGFKGRAIEEMPTPETFLSAVISYGVIRPAILDRRTWFSIFSKRNTLGKSESKYLSCCPFWFQLL